MGFGDYVFTALKGRQAGREYYVIMCPLKLVPKLFLFQEDELPPILRAQRTLNKSRIPEISKYITENKSDYIFSSLTVSVDAKVKYEPLAKKEDENYTDDIGKLSIPLEARFLINDGQHRQAAIEKALHDCPDLGDETISVVMFIDIGLKKSQQMFADLNKHAVRPTRSIGILYDHRDPLSCLARDVVKAVSVFTNLTELEKTSISNRSTKLFTLSSIYEGTRLLLGKPKKAQEITEAEKNIAIAYWTEVTNNMPDWILASSKEISTYELRKEYIHSHGIMMIVLGRIGNYIKDDYSNILKGLLEIDWSRSKTELWEGRVMHNGRISNSHNSILLTTNLLKLKFQLQLTDEEKDAEKKYLKEL